MDKYLKDFAYVLRYYDCPKEWYTLNKIDTLDDICIILYITGSRPFALGWYKNIRQILLVKNTHFYNLDLLTILYLLRQ